MLAVRWLPTVLLLACLAPAAASAGGRRALLGLEDVPPSAQLTDGVLELGGELLRCFPRARLCVAEFEGARSPWQPSRSWTACATPSPMR